MRFVRSHMHQPELTLRSSLFCFQLKSFVWDVAFQVDLYDSSACESLKWAVLVTCVFVHVRCCRCRGRGSDAGGWRRRAFGQQSLRHPGIMWQGGGLAVAQATGGRCQVGCECRGLVSEPPCGPAGAGTGVLFGTGAGERSAAPRRRSESSASTARD